MAAPQVFDVSVRPPRPVRRALQTFEACLVFATTLTCRVARTARLYPQP